MEVVFNFLIERLNLTSLSTDVLRRRKDESHRGDGRYPRLDNPHALAARCDGPMLRKWLWTA